MKPLAWGAKVSPYFRVRLREIAKELGIEPDWLMACIAFETGETFSPSIKNTNSTATGLIQFMAATARSMGTTCAQLAAMTAEAQLEYVLRYFSPWRGKLKTFNDCYMAILWPRGIGKPDDYVLWKKGVPAYAANYGLEINHDGAITKAEACRKVHQKLLKGQTAKYAA